MTHLPCFLLFFVLLFLTLNVDDETVLKIMSAALVVLIHILRFVIQMYGREFMNRLPCLALLSLLLLLTLDRETVLSDFLPPLPRQYSSVLPMFNYATVRTIFVSISILLRASRLMMQVNGAVLIALLPFLLFLSLALWVTLDVGAVLGRVQMLMRLFPSFPPSIALLVTLDDATVRRVVESSPLLLRLWGFLMEVVGAA